MQLILRESKDKQKFQKLQSRIIQSKLTNKAVFFSSMYYRADVCESKVEVTTPFWVSNSNGKVRAIVNNEQFEQAIHQEICT